MENEQTEAVDGCPFCGVAIVKVTDGHGVDYFHCDDCDYSVGVEVWLKRTSALETQAERIKQLEKQVVLLSAWGRMTESEWINAGKPEPWQLVPSIGMYCRKDQRELELEQQLAEANKQLSKYQGI